MRRRDYDTMYDENSGGTETHLATDVKMDRVTHYIDAETSYEEGFASASGVRNETAESGGRLKHPETKDDARVPGSIEHENAGLADN